MTESDPVRVRILLLSGLLAFSIWALIACTETAQTESISPAEVSAMLDSETPRLILDVRTRQEFAAGHIPGALNIPHTELEARLDELNVSSDTPVIVYCQSGGRAGQAEAILQDAGFKNILDLTGHMGEWRAKDLPLER